MRKKLPLVTVLLVALAAILAVPGGTFAAAKISASEYTAGDTVTIEGTIEPGQDLYIAIAQQKMFAVNVFSATSSSAGSSVAGLSTETFSARFSKQQLAAKTNRPLAINPTVVKTCCLVILMH